MEETLNNLFNRAVASVAENAGEISVTSHTFDKEENKLVARVEFDDIEQDITLQFQSGDPEKGFELGYDRIYLVSSVSEIGTVIVDQTNTAFEDENSANDAIDELYTQITNPLSNVLDVLMAEEAVQDEENPQKKKFTQHLSLGHVVLAIGVVCRDIVSAYNKDICVACRGHTRHRGSRHGNKMSTNHAQAWMSTFHVQFSQILL